MDFYYTNGIVRCKDDGWIIIECDYSVVKYYQWWVEKLIGQKTSTSFYKPHITVVAGKHEKPDARLLYNWKKYNGTRVPVKYESKIYTDSDYLCYGSYFWLRIECNLIVKIRKDLGLGPNLKWPYHLTICYCENKKRVSMAE